MKEHRFAVILAGLIFCLILLGGVVHNTGSSLACPDWPTCYGSLMPEMKGGVAIEHSHRLAAASVGLLTIVLSALLYKKRKNLQALGFFAVFLVIFQGVLGGVTVLLRLPTAVSTAHLATSFIFLAVILYIAWKTETPRPATRTTGAGWVKAAAVLVYAQSVLGAFMRHTGAGLVCPEIPFCYGSLWPAHMPPIVLLHMAHRWMGVVAALAVLPLPFIVRGGDGRVRFLSNVAPLLVLIQVGLGLASVWTQLGIVSVTAHLGMAALLWSVLISLVFLTNRAGVVRLPFQSREVLA
ncbi:MAG TPA: COX15/CtaA family protein [bacterium]|nr:COX15/CtaA family protein [bacterium]